MHGGGSAVSGVCWPRRQWLGACIYGLTDGCVARRGLLMGCGLPEPPPWPAPAFIMLCFWCWWGHCFWGFEFGLQLVYYCLLAGEGVGLPLHPLGEPVHEAAQVGYLPLQVLHLPPSLAPRPLISLSHVWVGPSLGVTLTIFRCFWNLFRVFPAVSSHVFGGDSVLIAAQVLCT